MLILTWNEIENLKVYEMDDRIYKRVKNNLSKSYGERIAERVMTKSLESSLKALLNCSAADLLEGIKII